MRAAFAAIGCMLAACGGEAVVEESGTGGRGGASSTQSGAETGVTGGSTTGVTVGQGGATTIGTGVVGCTAHDQCPGGVCIFGTGTCAERCDGGEFCSSCGPGTVCESCATSSCPECDDCVAACFPTQPGRCDDDDPCPAGEACVFSEKVCRSLCDPDEHCDGFRTCVACATSSCCGCKDCISVCVMGR